MHSLVFSLRTQSGFSADSETFLSLSEVMKKFSLPVADILSQNRDTRLKWCYFYVKFRLICLTSKNIKISRFSLEQRHWSVVSSFPVNTFKFPWSFWCHLTLNILFGRVFKIPQSWALLPALMWLQNWGSQFPVWCHCWRIVPPPIFPSLNALHSASGTSVSVVSAAFVNQIPSQLSQGKLSIKLLLSGSPNPPPFCGTQCFSSGTSHFNSSQTTLFQDRRKCKWKKSGKEKEKIGVKEGL